LTIEQKEIAVKNVIKQKCRILHINTTGQVAYMDNEILDYVVFPDMILVKIKGAEGIRRAYINAELIQIFDESKKEYIDLYEYIPKEVKEIPAEITGQTT
jgi:hypothetical protein